jgi:ATP-binding cassette subfamily F protein 3
MIQLSDITLRHGSQTLLEKTSATIYPGHKVGLIGANGSGKSSLFRLLLGQMELDAGDFSLPRDWTVAHMAQEINDLERSAIDFVTDGDRLLRDAERAVAAAELEADGHAIAEAHARLAEAGGYDAHARAGALLNGLGFDSAVHGNPVSSFSGGWRIRLNLARALMCPSDLLLLDEPTNHLDLETIVWLEDWIRRYQGTLLLISHDRDFLDQVVESVLHIEFRRLNAYRGGYSSFEQQRAERLAGQQAAHEKQQREIAHIRKFVDRFRAKATKARAAQSRIKALERMEVLAPAHVDSPFDFAFRSPPPATNPLVHLDEVRLGYPDRTVLEDVAVSLAPGDRIGLLGLNGAGKSTLVRALASDLKPLSGRMTASPKLQVGYFAQHQLEQLDPQASPVTHLARLTPESPEQRLRDFLCGFDFQGDMATAPVDHFSGGEKARLVLAMLVWRSPNLLLLDEPSNHLDLDMRHALTVALQGFEGAVITVSHDRHLLANTVDDFWLIDRGRVTSFDGDLDDYRRWLRERASQSGSTRSTKSAPDKKDSEPTARTGGSRSALKPLRNRAERLSRQVDQAAERMREIEQALAEPTLYTDASNPQLEQLLDERRNLESQQSELEVEWLEAEAALEHALNPGV